MKNLLTGLQGFGFGAIVMAYICNYNKDQLPVALVLLTFSVISRISENN